MELQAELQRLSGTTLDTVGAANDWAELARADWLDLLGALNTKAGLARADWLDLEGVLNYLAGTTGLGANAAAALIGLGYGLVLPGTSGNYASSPDSVLNSVTGDIDIRVCVKLTDWTPGASNYQLVAKRNDAGNNNSYSLRLGVAGVLALNWSPTGAGGASITVSSTVGNTLVDGSIGWVRATLDVDNGAGGNDVKFYTSTDGITWTQLGTTVTTAGVTSIFDGTSVLELGSRNAGVNDLLTGTVYYAEIRAGIDGQVVARFDTNDVVSTGTMLPATLNGWTVAGTAVKKYEDYVRLPGTAGNYLSWPDTAANSVTGDIDIRCQASLDDWTPATAMVLVSKWTTNQVGYQMYVDTAGKLTAQVSGNGTTADLASRVSASALGFVDGSVWWVRFTRDATIGTVTLYTSPDGSTWTTIAGAGTQAAGVGFDSTAELKIGANFTNSNPLAGNVYAASVRSGIDGTVVASFDARDIETPWTINGSAWAWESSSPLALADMALSLPGTSGNYASTPDSAATSIVGDIDLRAEVTLTDWTPATASTFIAKEQSSTTRSYRFGMGGASAGVLFLMVSVDGTTATAGLGSSVAVPFADGAVGWVRATWRQSDGRVQFFTGSDGASWTQLGTDRTLAIASIFDSTAVVEVGTRFAGTSEPLLGKVHYAAVHAGINGPIVARFDPSAVARTAARLPATLTQPGGTPNRLSVNQASIETDTTGWATGTGAPTLARSTAQFLDGAASLSLTAVAVGPADMSATTTPSTGIAVVAGKSYMATLSSRAATVARSGSVIIQWRTAADAFISNSGGSTTTNSTSAWTTHTVTGVAPATAAYAVVIPYIAATLATEVHYVDRISLVETPTVWTINGAAWDWVSAT